MKSFLFVFDQSRVRREIVISQVNRIEEVENWYSMFGNTMIFASGMSSIEISNRIREVLPELTFVVSEIDPATQGGWLPEPVWQFINDPRPATAESA